MQLGHNNLSGTIPATLTDRMPDTLTTLDLLEVRRWRRVGGEGSDLFLSHLFFSQQMGPAVCLHACLHAEVGARLGKEGEAWLGCRVQRKAPCFARGTKTIIGSFWAGEARSKGLEAGVQGVARSKGLRGACMHVAHLLGA